MALVQIAFIPVGVYVQGAITPVSQPSAAISENITPSGTNQQSAANEKRKYVRIATDTAVYIAVGANPDATTTTSRCYMPANSVEYFLCEVGNKVAVVTA